MSYSEHAKEMAGDTISHYEDEIIDFLVEETEAATDIQDFPNGDSYHHETHVDRDYNLEEAAELVEELSDHAETDAGLWEGKEPSEVLSAQAAWTFGNAVAAEFQFLMEEINSEYASEVDDLFDEGHLAEEKPDWWDVEAGEVSEEKRREVAKAIVDRVYKSSQPEPPDMSSHDVTVCVPITVRRSDGGDINNYDEADKLAVKFVKEKFADFFGGENVWVVLDNPELQAQVGYPYVK